MLRRQLQRSLHILSLTALILVIGAVSESLAAPTLKRSDFYRYRSWTKTVQTTAIDSSAVLIYPHGRPAIDPDAVDLQGPRLGAAARSLVAMEDVLIREWIRTKSYTADQSLATARSYRDVGEYGHALTWYRRSAQRRHDSTPLPAIRREMFATAVLTGDSLQVTTELLNLLGRARLDSEQESLELAFRWLLVADPGRNLDLTMEKTSGQLELLGPRIRFWYAYAEAVRQNQRACLDQLLRLLGDDRSPAALSPEQSAWALKTIPDLLYLEGRRDDALRLYAVLAETGDEGGAWARYQLANMHFLAGEYVVAGELFQEFCRDEPVSEAADWRGRACSMATLVARMADLRKEGETYGIDGIHTR